MKFKFTFKSAATWIAVLTAIRTAGALMIGNAVVLPLLTDAANRRYWLIVLILGVIILILSSATSVEDKE